MSRPRYCLSRWFQIFKQNVEVAANPTVDAEAASEGDSKVAEAADHAEKLSVAAFFLM